MDALKKNVDLVRIQDVDKNAKIYKNIMRDGIVLYG